MENLFFPDRWNSSGRSYRPYAYHPSRRTYYPSAASEPISASPAKKTKVISIPVHGQETNISSSPLVPVSTPDANNRKLVDSGNAARLIQKVARGFLVRKNMKIVRKISGEADEIAQQISPERVCGNAKERLRINEMLMALLLRLDAVRGVREYRKKVIRRVIQLQEALDSIAQAGVAEVQDSDPTVVKESKVDDTVMASEAIEYMNNDQHQAMDPDTEDQIIDEVAQNSDEIVCGEVEGECVLEEPTEDATGENEVGTNYGTREDEAALMKEMMERSMAESEALKRMVRELCERSAQQCELMSGLVQRVAQLEKRVQCTEKRKKKKKGNSHTKKQ